MKWLLAAMLISLTNGSSAQGSDILVLKKGNGRTLHSYFKGTNIHFIDVSGHENAGIIRKIDKDSVFIQYQDIRMRYTMWGTSVADTISTFFHAYHYNEIAAIMKPARSFGFIRNGSLFILAGTGYSLLHVVNAAIKKEQIDPATLAVAGTIALGGLLLQKLQNNSYRIGRRFELKYIDMKNRP